MSINIIQRVIVPGGVTVCLLDTVTVFVLFYLPLLHQLVSCAPLSLATVDRLQAGKGTTGKDFCLLGKRPRGSFQSGNFTWEVVGAVGWLP